MGERPIVVLGCPRSGTTLLTTMLHAHPRIAVPPETRWLQRAYKNRDRFGDLRETANRRKLARFIIGGRNTKFEDLGLDPERTADRILTAAPTLGSAFAAVFEQFAESRGKPRWGEKRPSYAFWVDRLLALWPHAQFVHLVRDPRACAASLIRTSWWTGGFPQAVTVWVRTEAELSGFAPRADPGQYVRLRYEDLVTDPRPQLERLCAALGERFEEVMLARHAEAAGDMVPERATHHALTRAAVDPSRIDAWRTDLAPEQIGLIERVARRAMAERGYEPSGLGVRPPLRLLAAYEDRHGRSTYVHRRDQLLDARRRKHEPYPLAATDR